MNNLYLFRTNLIDFPGWERRIPELRAVWYDGSSKTLSGFGDRFASGRLIIEDGLLPIVRSQIATPNLEFIHQVDALDLASDSLPHVWAQPSNDTHVHSFSRLASVGCNLGFRLAQVDKEDAAAALTQINPSAKRVAANTPPQDGDLLLLANDWGSIETTALITFKQMGLLSAVLQESVIDFNGPICRMQWADAALIQGAATFDHLKRRILFLTGNPRYENLHPLPQKPDNPVLINCNFTYGILEGVRKNWLQLAVDGCRQAGLDFLIAQHPRDKADLSTLPSRRTNAATIQELLINSSILITRFSSLVHEALALGRPVVYLNPHGEHIGYDFEPDGEHLFMVRQPEQLAGVLQKLRSSRFMVSDPFWSNYAWRHSAALDGNASERVCEALNLIAQTERHLLRNYSEMAKVNLHYLARRIKNGIRKSLTLEMK